MLSLHEIKNDEELTTFIDRPTCSLLRLATPSTVAGTPGWWRAWQARSLKRLDIPPPTWNSRASPATCMTSAIS